jgi:hypothetical protein
MVKMNKTQEQMEIEDLYKQERLETDLFYAKVKSELDGRTDKEKAMAYAMWCEETP